MLYKFRSILFNSTKESFCIKTIKHNIIDLSFPSSSQRINNNIQKNNYKCFRKSDSIDQCDNNIILPINLNLLQIKIVKTLAQI